LWVAAEFVGSSERLLGTNQVAAQSSDLADLVVALGDRPDMNVGHVLAGLGGFAFRLLP
jgi:hypothetical protein